MSTSNSLSLLAQDYDGSDSNPEEDDKDTGPSHKRPKLALALPPAFAKEDKDDIKEEDEVVHDNPDDHQGRVRSFEHVKGNWATYVYISLRAIESELKALAKIVRETCNGKKGSISHFAGKIIWFLYYLSF